MSGRFALRYAVRSLRRGGERTALALACVAFGVLSLVAMQLLAVLIGDAILVDPRAALGGDLRLRPSDGLLDDRRLAELDQLRADGTLAAYSLRATSAASLLQVDGSGSVYFVGRVLGVDPATFPLVGSARLRTPAGGSLAAALAQPRAAVITYDLAEKLDVGVGAHLRLSGTPGSPPERLQVAGIAEALPDRQGDSLLYSLDTARQIAGGAGSFGVAAMWGPRGGSIEPLEAAGWEVALPDQAQDQRIVALFGFMLKGAGLLGLLAGGIGMANTLQVVLARRVPEIATLKTLGYRQRDLLLLFGLETALLGGLGSIVGVAGALAVARQLMALLDRTEGSIMLAYRVDWSIVVGGLLAGTVTAVIFGLYAIVRASAVRPSVLLRQLPLPATVRTRLLSAALGALLLTLFGALCAVIMQSALLGLAVVGVALAGLIGLGGLLGAVLWLTVRLPVRRFPLVALAQRNLRHRPLRAIFALMALFVGVFTIGFAGTTMLSAERRVSAQARSNAGPNLNVYGRAADDATTQAAIERVGGAALFVSYEIAATVGGPSGALPQLSLLHGRQGRTQLADVTVVSGAWRGGDGALAPVQLSRSEPGLSLGDAVAVATPYGQRALWIVGFYDVPPPEFGVTPPQGLIVDRAVVDALGAGTAAATYTLAVAPAELDATAAALGAALPDAMVVSKANLNRWFVRVYAGLFTFVAAIASLALVAGAVLIANAVGLAMVERRRELGVLKAIGYSSRDVLRSVLIENGLLGGLAGAAGIAAVALAVQSVNAAQPNAGLELDPLTALGVAAVALALALGSAVLVAWRPVHLRPLAVLRSE